MCHEMKRTRITPQHLQLAIRSDEELSILVRLVIVPQGGVLSYIQDLIMPKKNIGSVGPEPGNGSIQGDLDDVLGDL